MLSLLIFSKFSNWCFQGTLLCSCFMKQRLKFLFDMLQQPLKKKSKKIKNTPIILKIEVLHVIEISLKMIAKEISFQVKTRTFTSNTPLCRYILTYKVFWMSLRSMEQLFWMDESCIIAYPASSNFSKMFSSVMFLILQYLFYLFYMLIFVSFYRWFLVYFISREKWKKWKKFPKKIRKTRNSHFCVTPKIIG